MKKTLILSRLIIVVAFVLSVQSVCAQDKLITKNGEVITAYDVDVGGSSVYYRLKNTSDAALQSIAKNKVLIIKKQDGTSINLYEDGQGEVVTQNLGQSEQPTAVQKLESEPYAARNMELINAINNANVIYSDDKQDKKAKAYFCQLFAAPTSVMANKDIEVTYTCASVDLFSTDDKKQLKEQSLSCVNSSLIMTIKNKSDKNMFIDLGNTFLTMNGESVPYYIPQSTSSSTGKESGVGVNLGAVTNAAGIGGVIGTLASGVTIGGGKSSSSTTTTYSQRVISIPPFSSKKIDAQRIFPSIDDGNFGSFYYNNSVNIKNGYTIVLVERENNRGEIQEWNYDESPIKIGTYITYSFNESFLSNYSVHTEFYLKKIIAGKVTFLGFDGKQLSGITPQILFFTATKKKK